MNWGCLANWPSQIQAHSQPVRILGMQWDENKAIHPHFRFIPICSSHAALADLPWAPLLSRLGTQSPQTGDGGWTILPKWIHSKSEQNIGVWGSKLQKNSTHAKTFYGKYIYYNIQMSRNEKHSCSKMMVNELCNIRLIDYYGAFENIFIEFLIILKFHE